MTKNTRKTGTSRYRHEVMVSLVMKIKSNCTNK